MAARTETSSPSFVTSDAGALRAAAVARPSFGIETLAPIQGEPSAIGDRALEQHDVLVARLRAHGVNVAVADADPSCPMGIAAADIAVVVSQGAILMRPSDLGRRNDVARLESALSEAHIPIVGRIEPPGILDGGDVMVGPDALYVAVPNERASATGIPRFPRGNALGRNQLTEISEGLGLPVVPVATASEVRRLRGVAAFVDQRTVLLASDVVDAGAFGNLERIEVPRGEEYGGGILALGERRVIANLRFRTLLPILRRARIAVDAIDLWEFGKVGITPSTLVLALRRG
jgi:dimethylargininase